MDRALRSHKSTNGSQAHGGGHASAPRSPKPERDLEKAVQPGAGTSSSTMESESKDQYLQFYSTKRMFDRLGRTSVDLVTRKGKEFGKPNHAWLHIRDESMTLQRFCERCLELTSGDPEYVNLIKDLLSEVQKTNEKSFVRGRYLRPTAVVRQTRRGGRGGTHKRITFFAMPYFSIRNFRHETLSLDKHFEGFPVRGLLQSVYSLESTTHRELEQISSITLEDKGLVHVPEVWALMIGKRALITRTSMQLRNVQGQNIKQIRFRPNGQDRQNGDDCIVHLIDKANNMYYIPVEECSSFYEFVSHVLTNCLQNPTADTDKLDFRDESRMQVNEHSWTKLLSTNDQRKVPVIRITLGNEPKARRIDTDHWQENDSSDTPTHKSDRSRRGGGSSYMSYRGRGEQDLDFLSTVGEELKTAYEALRNAKLNMDHETIYALEFRQIPEIEDRFMTMLNGTLATSFEQVDGEQEPTQSIDVQDVFNRGELLQMGRKITQHMPRSFKFPLFDPQVRRYGRFSEIASFVKVPSPSESSSSGADSSDAGVKGYHEEIWFKKPKKAWRRGRKEPAIQYVPSKAALGAVLSDIPTSKGPDMRQGLQVNGKSLYLGNDLAEASKAERLILIKTLHERLLDLLRDGQQYRPLFQWPLGLDLGLEDGGSLSVELLLHDIDRECNPTDSSATSGLGIKICYKRAEIRSISEVEDLLYSLHKTSEASEKLDWAQTEHDVSLQSLIGCQVGFYQIAKVLEKTFVPGKIDKSVVLGRYWGAVYRIIANARQSEGIIEVLDHATKLAENLRTFQKGSLNSNHEIPPNGYVLPQAIPVAFKSLIYFFIAYSLATNPDREFVPPGGIPRDPQSKSNLSDFSHIYINYKTCKVAIKDSKHQILAILSRSKKDVRLGQFDMVSGEDLACLMLSELQNHLKTEQGDFLLSELYTDYANKMQYHVTKSASVQTYDEINRFREEIAAIKSTLSQQNDLLRDLGRILFTPRQSGDYGAEKETIRHRVVKQLRDQVNERQDAFSELSRQADRIQLMAAQSISLKSEANNRAIVIFTIVTIVFLPLSFVTSFFGMNTADIRDIDNRQWIFWASAMPLTVVVVLIAIVTGYWERLQRWAGLLKREKVD